MPNPVPTSAQNVRAFLLSRYAASQSGPVARTPGGAVLTDVDLEVILQISEILQAVHAPSERPAGKQIATREELDALPVKVVIKDNTGAIWQRLYGDAWSATGQTQHYSSDSICLPARVLQ